MATASKKLYYKIGEACRKLDIQPYVLRYWETEFPFLKPDKSRSGQRVYTPEELEIIRRVKELLYDEGYTIAGAKKKLEAELESGGPAPATDPKAEEPKQPEAGSDAESPEDSQNDRKTRAEDAEEAQDDPAAGPRLDELRSGLGELLTQARGLLEELSPRS